MKRDLRTAVSGDCRQKVLVTWPEFPDMSSGTARSLIAAGFELVLAPKLDSRTPEALIRLVHDCDAAIVSTDPFTADVLAAAPRLRIISRVGVGTDSIDLSAAAEHGIMVTAARGSNEYAVAEHTVGLMLALMRRTVAQDRSVREGEWPRTGAAVGSDLGGKTVGLIGLGSTGLSVARMLAAFGVRVIGHDPAVNQLDGVHIVTLSELLRRSDLISLHVPLTGETTDLIDSAAIAKMREGVLLVNTARGGIVDEEALAAALISGHVAGAALDVFAEEPPRASPLLLLPGRTILTPHIAGITHESIKAMVDHATQAVLDWASGRIPQGLVTPRPAHL